MHVHAVLLVLKRPTAWELKLKVLWPQAEKARNFALELPQSAACVKFNDNGTFDLLLAPHVLGVDVLNKNSVEELTFEDGAVRPDPSSATPLTLLDYFVDDPGGSANDER